MCVRQNGAARVSVCDLQSWHVLGLNSRRMREAACLPSLIHRPTWGCARACVLRSCLAAFLHPLLSRPPKLLSGCSRLRALPPPVLHRGPRCEGLTAPAPAPAPSREAPALSERCRGAGQERNGASRYDAAAGELWHQPTPSLTDNLTESLGELILW